MKIPTQQFSGFDKPIKDSWIFLWKKPFVFFPIGYRLFGMAFIGLIMVLLVWLLAGTTSPITDFSKSSKMSTLILFGFLLVVFEFHVKSLQIVLFKKVASHKKIILKDCFRESFSLYPHTTLTILSFLLVGAVITAFIGGLFVLSTSLTSVDIWTFGKIILVGLIALGGLILALFFSAWMLFWMPIIAFSHKKPLDVLKQCSIFLRKDGKFVWSVYIIKLGVGLGISVIFAVISAMLKGGADSVPLWWNISHFVLNSILMTWLMLFVFRSFYVRYKPKV